MKTLKIKPKWDPVTYYRQGGRLNIQSYFILAYLPLKRQQYFIS